MSVERNISTYQTSLLNRQNYTFLKEEDLHIWQVSLVSNHALLDICKSALCSADQEKSKWLKFKKDQNKYLISQGVLRLLLADYLNIKTSEINISRHEKGKPFVENDRSIFFNMSNSGNLCVYAFRKNTEVGIDIEEKRSLPDLDDLIKKNLTKTEIEYINKKPQMKSNNFFRFWTMKEAYLKAIGEGMRLTPDNLEFSIENDNIRLMNQYGLNDQEDWIIKEFLPKTSYFGTTVYKNKQTKISHFVLE